MTYQYRGTGTGTKNLDFCSSSIILNLRLKMSINTWTYEEGKKRPDNYPFSLHKVHSHKDVNVHINYELRCIISPKNYGLYCTLDCTASLV